MTAAAADRGSSLNGPPPTTTSSQTCTQTTLTNISASSLLNSPAALSLSCWHADVSNTEPRERPELLVCSICRQAAAVMGQLKNLEMNKIGLFSDGRNERRRKRLQQPNSLKHLRAGCSTRACFTLSGLELHLHDFTF